MAEMPGIARPERQALPQLRDRMTFLYLEHCTLGRECFWAAWSAIPTR